MSEKSMLLSRLFPCLIAVSMFLLIFSSSLVFRFSDNSFIPAVFKIIDVNSTSVYFRPDFRSKHTQPPSISSVPSQLSSNQSSRSQEIIYQNSISSKMDTLEQDKEKVCYPNQAILRVFMYDLPPEFHFGLMGWRGSPNQVWPDVSNRSQIPSYPGGLNLQHSMEYWLILDLLSPNTPDVVRPCSAIRVQNPNQADIIFVPFFSSLSYNRYSKLRGKEKVSINRMLQDKLVEFLKGRDEWKRLGGKDHVIVAHHPNSMLTARRKLGSAMFVLADFGRYPVETANLEKDVIAPYKHIIKTTPANNSASFEHRPILVYFQGAIYRKDIHYWLTKAKFETNNFVGSSLIEAYAKCGNLGDVEKVFNQIAKPNVVSWNFIIKAYAQYGYPAKAIYMFNKLIEGGERPTSTTFVAVLSACSHSSLLQEGQRFFKSMGGAIRQELYYLLKDEKDVHFTFGSVGANGINQAGQGMASSKFCLNIAGDTPSSNRLFDAIATHCVPVIISDDIELPFEDVLDYSEFCIFVRASNAVKKGYLLNLLRGIEQDKWTKMWERLKEIEKHFEYQFPSRPDDAVNMIWGVVSRKLSKIQNEVNRKNRYRRSQLLLKTP